MTYANGTIFSKIFWILGKTIIGSYQVHLPDGRLQTVKYTANHYTGYVPEITYEGKADYDNHKPAAAPSAPSYHKLPTAPRSPAYQPPPRLFYNNIKHSKSSYYELPKSHPNNNVPVLPIPNSVLHRKTTLYDVHEQATSFKTQPKDDHPQRVTIYDPTTLYRSNVPAKPKAKANARSS